ncbi:DUF1553 domain-containing protein, partial [Salmonella sp. SAL4457]|uniref:DUF1553 domain-containing protein n=1 Tax=Salmonella sp. SAL4457 TaxID=3159912 RepID=UPI00397DF8E6
LKVFDVASPNECFERSESIVPQQALALANGKLSQTMSRILAQQLSPAPPQPNEAFVASAFDRILGRQPHSAELKESLAYLNDQTAFY